MVGCKLSHSVQHSVSVQQVREKNDKFQQRRLDGFFKAGVKACDEACEAEEPEQAVPLEVMAMEVEMEVQASHTAS